MGKYADYGKAIAKHYEQHAAKIGAQRYGTEEEMPAHMLTFSPVGTWQPGQAVHILGDKPAEVVDMVCPCCDAKIFVYYRILLPTPPPQEYPTDGTFTLRTADDDDE